jgi:hypothetical protein
LSGFSDTLPLILLLFKCTELFQKSNTSPIGIFYNIGYEQAITLAIDWNSVWLPDEVKKSIPVGEPYIFIRLTGVEQISTANYIDIGNISRIIGSCEFEEIEGKKFLAIDDVFGGQINIVYKGEETFLALEKNRRILNI